MSRCKYQIKDQHIIHYVLVVPEADPLKVETSRGVSM